MVRKDIHVNKQSSTPRYRGTGVYVGFVAVLTIIAALVILAAQNTEPVRFAFLQWDLEYPLVAILLATIGGTIALDELVGWIWRRRRRRVLTDRAELKELRAEKVVAQHKAAEERRTDARETERPSEDPVGMAPPA